MALQKSKEGALCPKETQTVTAGEFPDSLSPQLQTTPSLLTAAYPWLHFEQLLAFKPQCGVGCSHTTPQSS